MTKLKLDKACGQYGAQMGRRDELPCDPEAPISLRLERLNFVDGDYDEGGAYWGHTPGTAIYCAWGEDDEVQVRVFIRAKDRFEAIRLVRESVPNATF